MADLLEQPWFWWAAGVVVGLPVLTIALTELNAHLVRRRSSMAGPVQTLRLYVLPLGALLVLLTQIPNTVISNEGGWVRIVATIFGFLVLSFVLSGVNTALFLNATEGSWRRRMPSIFVDLGRIVIIAIGLAILLSVVWGADVGGLFAALGVTSIVLGLALQTAVGSIIAGLLLLFEQPFQLGDWLKTSSAEGRVVEVNWRAVHIDTGNGITIIPNSSLAEAAFTNLSRPTVAYTETVTTTFSQDDAPLAVMALLDEVARGLSLTAGREPSTVPTGAGGYRTDLPLSTFADAGPARAQFLTRVWYAARRKNLGLDGADIWKGESTSDVLAVLHKVAQVLRLPEDQLPELATRMDLERYAEGEVIEAAGTVPPALRYIASGRVSLRRPVTAGGELTVLQLNDGDYLGQTTLTRTAAEHSSVAASQVDVLTIPADVLDDLVRSDHRLARELGRQLDQRRELLQAAPSDAGLRAAEMLRGAAAS